MVADIKDTWKHFDLFVIETVSIKKRRKITTQGRTRTFRILISLPYHYITTPTRLTRQSSEKFKYIQ